MRHRTLVTTLPLALFLTGADGDGCNPAPWAFNDGTEYYFDGDGDTYGDDEAEMIYVEPGGAIPEDAAFRGGDCDDADEGVNPEAEERCNGIDDDCSDANADIGRDDC
jgi:hypothetical protein